MILKSLIMLKNLASARPGAHVNCGETGGCDTGLPQVDAGQLTSEAVLQVVFGILGGIALIVIILAALQFVTSNGDSQSAARARNTILYAAIGLFVCISAEVIVTFVINHV